MGRSAAVNRDHEPGIRYVLVVREDNVPDPPAQGYELVGQVVYRYPDSGAVTVVARAFRIVR